MDAAELDEQFDKVLALIPLAKEQEPLEEIATTLDVNIADEIAAGSKRAIYRKILAHLNSPDFDNAAERERLILAVRDTIQAHLGFDPGMPKLEDSDEDGSEDERAKEKQEEENKVRNRNQMAVLSGVKLKEFKFDGSVGYPGEKGKLDYAGVMHNINMGKQRGFDETEICSAAIRAITPGHPTRTYLEGRSTLTLEKVKASFKAHFIQRDVTDIYNDMVHAIQGSGPKDTAMSFVLTMFSLRDRIIDMCKDKRSGERKYTPKLVQGEMQKSIYNGLKDDNIRQDLKQILKQKNLDDDDLLSEVREAMISKAERDKKFLDAATKKKPSVSAVQAQSDSDSQTLSKQNNNNKSNNKKTTNSKSNLPVQNLDPFMAQLSSVIGSHVQGIVAPLQSQIQDLTKFKDRCESQKNSGSQVQQLNAQAPSFKSNQNGDGGNSAGGAKTPVGGVVNPVSSGNAVVNGGGAAVSEEFLTNLFRSVMNCGNNSNNNNNNRNSNRNYRNNNNNNNNTCNGVVLNSKCNICRTAGALFCNHCRICHAVDHRTPTCPHRTDPNYVPKN